MVSAPGVTVRYEVTLTLGEAEARALEAFSQYNPDTLLKKFFDEIGKSALEPFALGYRSLMASVAEQLRPQLAKVDKAREALTFMVKSGTL